MPSLNLDLDYFDHPKTRRLVGLLGRGAEVLPIKLWSYCGKFHAEDGRLAGYSPQEIESIVGWWGKEGECIAVMLREGTRFLHPLPDGDGFQAHDWLEHQGHFAMYRERARHAAAARWGKARDAPRKRSNATSNATSIAQAMLKQCPRRAVQCNPPLAPPSGGAESVGSGRSRQRRRGNTLRDEQRRALEE